MPRGTSDGVIGALAGNVWDGPEATLTAASAIRFNPSTGSARRDAWSPARNSGTATANTDPLIANTVAASMGERERTRRAHS
jgi:hypothetical protein